MALAQTPREGLSQRAVLLLVLGIALVIPSLVWPGSRELYTYRSLAISLVAIALLLTLGLRGNFSAEAVRRFVRTGPNLAILLFLAWSGITYLDSPFKAYGRFQLLALAGGIVVYFAVTYRLPARRQLQKLVAGLTTAVILSVVVACLFFQEQGGRLVASFGNPQLYGGFLVVLLPLVLAAAQAEEHPLRRATAQFATILAVAALLVTHNRSAWFGAMAGLLVLGVLAARSSGGGRALLRYKHSVVLPAALLVGAVAVFVVSTGMLPGLAERLSSTTKSGPGESLTWRTDMWAAAWQMLITRPIEGWGVGAYPIFVGYLGAPGLPTIVGPAPPLNNIAHNYYAQTAAETGIVGIGLYLAILICFFLRCTRALRVDTSQTRKWLLIGSMGAVAAQMVDAFSSPAWQFADVSVFLWIAMGIGVAASRPRAEREAAEAAVAPCPALVPARGRARFGGALAAQVAVLACAAFLATQAWAVANHSGQGGNTAGGGTGVAGVIDGCDYVEVISCRITGPHSLRRGECGNYSVLATLRCDDGHVEANVNVTEFSTITSDLPSCLAFEEQTTDHVRFCVPQDAVVPCHATLTGVFNAGGGVFECTATIPVNGVKGGGGGGGDDGGGGAGIIIGAIAGAGLLFFLLGRKKKKGGDGGDEKGGGCEGGNCPPGTVPSGGMALNLPSYERVTSIRTNPSNLVVHNGEEQKIRVFVQLDGRDRWYDVTDHPDTDFTFENGTASLVASGTLEDKYMVTRSQARSGDLKVLAAFHGQQAEVPVSFRAP